MQSQLSIPDSVCEENRQFLNSMDYMQVLHNYVFLCVQRVQYNVAGFETVGINGAERL